MLKNILNKCYFYYLSYKKIKNLFGKKNKKKALLIYLVEPFFRTNVSHGNFYEARGIAYALDLLNYNVDVINHSSKKIIDGQKYDLIIGFGEAFNRIFNKPVRSSTAILYATSQHSFVLNKSAMSAVKRFYKNSKIFDLSLVRYRQNSWQASYDLVDGIIVVDGTGLTNKTYRENSLVNPNYIKSVSPPYIQVYHGPLVQSESTRQQFLWFAGDGPVHKGLDLLLDYFYKNENISLHVVGNISRHKIFFEYYSEHLKCTKNIFYHGFLDVKSPELLDIALNCDFVILPSCSEGMPNSLATIVGNFGCIPVVTEACSFSVPTKILISELTDLGVDQAVASCKKLKLNLHTKNENRDFVVNNYTYSSYIKSIAGCIEIISKN
jgi:Glycosyl transferases group 1